MSFRQVVLDTETTGLDVRSGHRVIEIGAVELVSRRRTGGHFHRYLNPDRDIDQGAIEVHGITSDFLADKPRFADVVAEFLDFVGDAELIIHNAEFDLQFLDAELRQAGTDAALRRDAAVIDTLLMARKLHPGQKNSLDALCRRYGVDNTHRELHGALLDAEILADVYLAMSGGQTGFSLSEDDARDEAAREPETAGAPALRRHELDQALVVVGPTPEEIVAHQALLDRIDAAADEGSLWRRFTTP